MAIEICEDVPLIPRATGAVAAALFAAGFEPGETYMKLPRCATCQHWDSHGAVRDIGICGMLTGGYAPRRPPVVTKNQPMVVTMVHTLAGFGCVEWKAKGS